MFHRLALRLATRFIVDRRPPDVVIGGDVSPYMRRWWVIPRNRWFNVYLHHFLRSDDDRALHDHPWWNISWLLDGDYVEIVPVDQQNPASEVRGIHRKAGQLAFRKADAAHRVVLLRGYLMNGDMPERPVWTIFITGPRIREWGFWCPKGWKHWKDFTAFRRTGNANEVGPGCEES